MRSLLVEFHRFGDPNSGIWRKGDKYLAAAASHPVREFEMPLDQDDFLDLVRDLRYRTRPEERGAALKKVGTIAAQLLGADSLKDVTEGPFPIQLDLVVNLAELAALPFEAATYPDGRPLFACNEPQVVLTRRIRHDFIESGNRWPATPRILYAWAAPDGVGTVPSAEHQKALRAALEPWLPVEPDGGQVSDDCGVLTVISQVSLAQLKTVCREAVAGNKPFTHVHLLGHGYPVEYEHRQRFGFALHGEDGALQAVTPEQIEDALSPLGGHAVVVTLASCDAADEANTTTLKRSIAHVLHQSGFPIVIGSQLPLTVPGSNLIVAIFYKALLGGEDVRVALHNVRTALYEARERTGHDWASVVGYARLPEGYADHLLDVRLESVLASLKMMQACSDKLVERDSQDPELFARVAQQLQERIYLLQGYLQSTAASTRRGVIEENLGLLGSAEKRLAELCFMRSRLGDTDRWRQLMRQALERSHQWYRRGYEHNLSHHWTGVQYLSLEAILGGKISDAGRWHAARAAADIDANRADEIWAFGSLAELYLLAPLANEPPCLDAARRAIGEMKVRIARSNAGTFPLESTERQLQRYVKWWTVTHGCFPGTSDLAQGAKALLDELRS